MNVRINRIKTHKHKNKTEYRYMVVRLNRIRKYGYKCTFNKNIRNNAKIEKG